ncbi:hypothetical protein BV25DRAFT_1911289 [Artomyces pyxidatus]|uniref:Uncharacterized protein n=1 Tax=Artomyces pyxidatus TaxID=48021 RepID=A0ACB8TIP0_9AGAM|nr:hypothetical protein BV25DRAFT_1911289 [Artomyces pyxidatus]
MSLAPSPSSARGDLILQPPFFHSSLFTTPFRADLQRLLDLFARQDVPTAPPFALFKRIWQQEGWPYMHLKVFDARTRAAYLTTVCRLFVERMSEDELSQHRVAALFALYTFCSSQPSTSAPPLYVLKNVEIAIDTYTSLLSLPKYLKENVSHLAPYASHIIKQLLDARLFHILPTSTLAPYNPRTLPREIFVSDDATEPEASTSLPSEASKQPKKKGRPSKRDIAKKTRDAVVSLDKWLERSGGDTMPAQSPTTSRTAYATRKAQLVEALLADENGGQQALERANVAVVNRLKKIDAMAAEKGLEVGSEGGEKTGLERVERAAGELGTEKNGGILGLLDGAGMSGPSRS